MKTARAGTLMALDMAEQPAVLRRLIARRDDIGAALRALLRVPPRGIALVGRGSSENAALCGRTLLEAWTGLPALIVPPSMVRLYGLHVDMHGYLAIGLSQSGRTPEIPQTLDAVRSAGLGTVGITADATSPVAQAVDVVIDLETGREFAVPATKTFTAEMAALAMIAETIAGVSWGAVRWLAAAEAVRLALDDRRIVAEAAERLDGVQHVSVIAAGMGVGLAHEVALKIMEAAGLPASAYSCESFRHGPISIASDTHAVVAVAIPGPGRSEVLETCSMLTGVPLVLIGDGEVADLRVASDLPEPLALIPAAVRGQQLALELALRRDRDPDRPPRLEKVTLP